MKRHVTIMDSMSAAELDGTNPMKAVFSSSVKIFRDTVILSFCLFVLIIF